jgi:hypothetical protein
VRRTLSLPVLGLAADVSAAARSRISSRLGRIYSHSRGHSVWALESPWRGARDNPTSCARIALRADGMASDRPNRSAFEPRTYRLPCSVPITCKPLRYTTQSRALCLSATTSGRERALDTIFRLALV